MPFSFFVVKIVSLVFNVCIYLSIRSGNALFGWYLTLLSKFQTSGSLYGALIGSLLAFSVADFLGAVPSLV